MGSYLIKPSSVVKNLGSWFDSKLNMLVHINKTCSSSFFYSYNLRRIRKYLTRQDTEYLVHSIIWDHVTIYHLNPVYAQENFPWTGIPCATNGLKTKEIFLSKENFPVCKRVLTPPSGKCLATLGDRAFQSAAPMDL